MATTVYLIRHAKQETLPGEKIWQPGAPLAPGSEERIQQLGEILEQRDVSFTQFCCSPFTRAVQTCSELIREMGQRTAPIVEPRLAPTSIEMWEQQFKALKQSKPELFPSGKHFKVEPAQWLENCPDLCDREASRVLEGIEAIVRRVPDGSNVAVICHIPLINLVEWKLTGRSPRPALNHCEAIIFTFDDGRFVDSELLTF